MNQELEKARDLTQIVYFLYAASIIIGVTAIVAVIINHLKRDEVAGTWPAASRTYFTPALWVKKSECKARGARFGNPNKQRATPQSGFFTRNPEGQGDLGALLCRGPLVVGGTTARPASRTASQIALAQGRNKSDWLPSHFRWQMRTFWFALMWGAIGMLTWIVGIGIVIWIAAGIWAIYRIVKGMLNFYDGKPMYQGA